MRGNSCLRTNQLSEFLRAPCLIAVSKLPISIHCEFSGSGDSCCGEAVSWVQVPAKRCSCRGVRTCRLSATNPVHGSAISISYSSPLLFLQHPPATGSTAWKNVHKQLVTKGLMPIGRVPSFHQVNSSGKKRFSIPGDVVTCCKTRRENRKRSRSTEIIESADRNKEPQNRTSFSRRRGTQKPQWLGHAGFIGRAFRTGNHRRRRSHRRWLAEISCALRVDVHRKRQGG